MLTVRRTTLIGACVLAAILTNIVLVDIFYGIDPGATAVALVLMWAMMWLISRKWNELLRVFWMPAQASALLSRSVRIAWGGRFIMLVCAFGFTYWVANYNNRSPTPLDGVWDVLQVTPQTVDAQSPETIFFERNRAFLSVFKTRQGLYQSHHFEVDPKKKEVRFWERLLRKEDLSFVATYDLSGSELTLVGTLPDLGHAELRLHRP